MHFCLLATLFPGVCNPGTTDSYYLPTLCSYVCHPAAFAQVLLVLQLSEVFGKIEWLSSKVFVILNLFQDPWINNQSLFLIPKISMNFKNKNFLDYNIKTDIVERFLRKYGVLFYPWILKQVQDDTVEGHYLSQDLIIFYSIDNK
jgi:hypothetical protein